MDFYLRYQWVLVEVKRNKLPMIKKEAGLYNTNRPPFIYTILRLT